jgi:hypothetical protein
MVQKTQRATVESIGQDNQDVDLTMLAVPVSVVEITTMASLQTVSEAAVVATETEDMIVGMVHCTST